MKAYHQLLFFITTVLFSIPAAARGQQPDFKTLQQIVGTWEMKKGSPVIREVWVRKNDTLFEGTSYAIKEGNPVLQETVQLVYTQNQVFFIPAVQNQNDGQPVVFRLISSAKGKFIFQNKEHDFPQQVIYHFKNRNRLDAAINGNTPKGFRQVNFPYLKVKQQNK